MLQIIAILLICLVSNILANVPEQIHIAIGKILNISYLMTRYAITRQ